MPGLNLDQITIKELLSDEEFKKYFLTVPKLPDYFEGKKPWKLYVKLKGKANWQAKRFETYKEAAVAFKKLMPKMDDAAINNPALGFRPPIKNVNVKGVGPRSIIWQPKLTSEHGSHTWCPYCRRPTIFKVLAHKLTLNGGRSFLVSPKLRCTICASGDDIIKIKNPEKEQAWDVNKPALYEIYRK